MTQPFTLFKANHHLTKMPGPRDTYALHEKMTKFDDWQLLAIFSNVAAIQLNTHCPVACGSRCGANATPGEGGYTIPWELFEEMRGTGLQRIWKYTQPVPWFGSDPLYYESQGRTIRDFYELFGREGRILTAVPYGTEERALSLLDLLGIVTIRRDRKERMKGFVSALERKAGEGGYDIEIRDDSEWLPLGKDHTNGLPDHGIVGFHGVLLTPTEIYSVRPARPSKEHPYGFVTTPVIPDDFSIPPLYRWAGTLEHEKLSELMEDLYSRFLNSSYEIDSEEKVLEMPFFGMLANRFNHMMSFIDLAQRNPSEPEDMEYANSLLELFSGLEEQASVYPRAMNDSEKDLLTELESWISCIENFLSGNKGELKFMLATEI